jgi:hypothetical protein
VRLLGCVLRMQVACGRLGALQLLLQVLHHLLHLALAAAAA